MMIIIIKIVKKENSTEASEIRMKNYLLAFFQNTINCLCMFVLHVYVAMKDIVCFNINK